jgi:hypothetical protein
MARSQSCCFSKCWPTWNRNFSRRPSSQSFSKRLDRQFLHHVLDRLEACVKAFLAGVQLEEMVDVAAVAETARGGRELDLLEAVDAQVGQHEFGPVLAQVAEEDQAQAVAQRFDEDAQGDVGAAGIPAGEGARVGEGLAQGFELLGLACTFLVQMGAEGGGDLGLGEQLEQFVEREHGVALDPAGGEQVRAASTGQPISA